MERGQIAAALRQSLTAEEQSPAETSSRVHPR
jgi:hypothetical protein